MEVVANFIISPHNRHPRESGEPLPVNEFIGQNRWTLEMDSRFRGNDELDRHPKKEKIPNEFALGGISR